jgi:hypothetical protein
MVNMVTLMIDSVLARSFETASSELIVRIKNAIDNFYINKSQNNLVREDWRTPKPWETRVLPNLEHYHNHLLMAMQAYSAGDIRPIISTAAGYAGLSKDIELDMSWMTEEDLLVVQSAIKRLVLVSDKIHRLGYEGLTGRGQS